MISKYFISRRVILIINAIIGETKYYLRSVKFLDSLLNFLRLTKLFEYPRELSPPDVNNNMYRLICKLNENLFKIFTKAQKPLSLFIR
jgi:hypothetical protein